MVKQRSKVFISYSHQDADWLRRLQVHLKPLTRLHQIEIWDDTQIQPGSQWRDKIAEALDTALVAVLLISADYLASDFIADDELPPLLKAAEDGGAVVLPVILSPCWFQNIENLSRFQAVNSPAAPLITAGKGEQEAALVRVAESIEAAFSSRRMENELQHMHQRLDEVMEKVARLFVFTMSGPMYENLRKLARPEGFGPYAWSRGLERELYYLRDMGYIEVDSVQAIPKDGANLSDFITVTETGREFVDLRRTMAELLEQKLD